MSDVVFKPDITLKDLYGPSTDEEKMQTPKPELDHQPTVKPDPKTGKNLVYEETPIITPVDEKIETSRSDLKLESWSNKTKSKSNRIESEMAAPKTEIQPQSSPPVSKNPINKPVSRNGTLPGCLVNMLFFIIIFSGGIGLSTLLKNYINKPQDLDNPDQISEVDLQTDQTTIDNGLFTPPASQVTEISPAPQATEIPPEPTVKPTPLPTITPPPPTLIPTPVNIINSQTADSSWSKYPVYKNSGTDSSLDIFYFLPTDINELKCDNTICSSRGTYLTGSTRFTVAVKQNYLSDELFLRSIVTDATGRRLQTAPATISNKPALRYEGTLSGTTTNGYRFTQISGIMIKLPGNLALEVNHFSPAGIDSDFTSDETLFEKILSSMKF